MTECNTATALPNPLTTVADLEQLLGQEALPLWFYAGSSKWCAPTAHALGHAAEIVTPAGVPGVVREDPVYEHDGVPGPDLRERGRSEEQKCQKK